ncbi:MAG: hypothetical protein EBY25_00560 [Betaproteobacteria bacterium]|nr:hypothetical protein [Betaproteobacteria bacterium]
MSDAERPCANPCHLGFRALARAVAPRKSMTISQRVYEHRQISSKGAATGQSITPPTTYRWPSPWTA